MRSVRNILCVSCGYIAAVIGAGFASGQEIISFFVKYGRYSIIGVFIACVIFALFSYAVLRLCVERRIDTYNCFLGIIFERKYARRAVEGVTLTFGIVSLCVMTACAGEIGFAMFGMSRIAGAFIFTILCGAVFFLNRKSIMSINSVLGAVIIFGIVFVCLYILRYREHQVFLPHAPMVVSGVTYAGYNLITVGAVLSGMSRLLSDGKEAAVSSAASGLMLFIIITLIWGVLGIYYGKINLGEIPMLTMALRQNRLIGVFYSIMLIAAVLTTGVSNGFSVIDMTEGFLGRKTAAVIVMMTGFCLSGAGFSNLINVAYRLCGYAGIIIVFLIIYLFVKCEKRSNTE